MSIPNSFVTTSGIDTLSNDDIARIVQLVEGHCSSSCLARLMRKQPDVPLIALDITNLHLIQRASKLGIPIIHISKDCKALQQSLVRDTRKRHRPIRTMLWAGLAFYFGLEQTWHRVVKGLAVSVSSILLVRELAASRRDYSVKRIQDEWFVIRDDAVQTLTRFCFLQVPLCCLAGVSAFTILRGRQMHSQCPRK